MRLARPRTQRAAPEGEAANWPESSKDVLAEAMAAYLGLAGQVPLRADLVELHGDKDGTSIAWWGDGQDLSYADGVLPVAVDLATGLATGQGHDVIVGSENVVGTFSADTLVGDAEDNLFRGYRADDTIRGRGGDDKLVGEGDDDGLFGGPGDDTLNGGPGTDRCRQGSGTGRRWNCER